MRALWLVLGLPVLFIGLLLVVWPALDSFPFPGSSGQFFFELWVPGIPLTLLGLYLVRRGLPAKKGAPT